MSEYEIFLNDLERLEAMKLEVEPALQAIKDLEVSIKKRAIDNGISETHGGVTVSYRKAYTRKGFSSKVLNELSKSIPEIEEARTETEIGETASIRVRFA